MIITNSKNDIFVKESIEVMSKITVSMEHTKDSLEGNIEKVNFGLLHDDIDLVKTFSDIKNDYRSVYELAASISKYSRLSTHEDTVLEKVKISALKKMIVESVNIEKLLPANSVIPDFNILITNLGLKGLLKTDTVTVRLVNIENREETTLVFNPVIEIKGLAEKGNILVSGLLSVSKESVCHLVIELRDENDNLYLSYNMDGINIYSRGGEYIDNSEI